MWGLCGPASVSVCLNHAQASKLSSLHHRNIIFFYGVVMQAPDCWMVTGIHSFSIDVVFIMLSVFILFLYRTC